MTRILDTFKSFKASVNGPSSMSGIYSPLAEWKLYGLYLIAEEDNQLVLLNYGGQCRDSFFIALTKTLATTMRDSIHIGMAVNGDKYNPKDMEEFIAENSSIPYVSDIKYEFKDEAIKAINKDHNNIETPVILNFRLLELHIPIELFANITTIWSLTFLLRYKVGKFGSRPNEYQGYLDAHLKLLRENYYDIIFTNKRELIWNMWSQCLKIYDKTTLWNGPVGVFSWKQAFDSVHFSDVSKDKPKFALFHKYLDVDKLHSSIHLALTSLAKEKSNVSSRS